MRTDILNPRQLFQKDVFYTIPAFQRPYVWSHDDQWEPLWDDVRNLAESYLEELERSDRDRAVAEQKTTPHFLGAVVLQQVFTATGEIEQREVIDGQQRVTTLQLLLDAIQQICEEREELKPVSTRLSKFVVNDADLVGDGSEQIFKLWPTRMDRDAFRHAMDNGLAVDGFEESLIVQAHEFFQQQVRKWLDDSAMPVSDSIRALETAVTTKLQMVVIDLDGNDDPNVIFETLNARGTPLEQSDLIKNFVLSETAKPGNAPEKAWEGLDTSWWRREVAQGRLIRPRLDMLFNYWLAMRTGEEVGPSRVFDVFRSYATETGVDVVMGDVQRDLANYRQYVDGVRTPGEEEFFYRTNVMQVGVITPVLLLLLSAEPDVRIRSFRAIESFLVRRMVCRRTTKDYNRITLELASRLREDGLSEADAIVAGYLKDQKADSREWPSDEAVTNSLARTQLYRLLTRGRLRLVLEGIESRMRTSKSEETDPPKNLTIEHLMPVSWGEHWPLSKEIPAEEARAERNNIVHTIGNLTLVTQQLNSAISNGPWEEKRKELEKHGTLFLNRELVGKDQWNENLITKRSKRLAGLLAQCWPGPDSNEWGL